MKLKNIVLFVILLITILILVPIKPVSGAEVILPTACNNLNISLRSKSKLVKIDSGYMRVFYDNSKICIEYYDDNFNITSKKTIAMELDFWGRIFCRRRCILYS